MKDEQPEEVLFDAALKLPAAERIVFLDKACAGDVALRSRVEALLGAFERADGFMKQSAAPERTSNLVPAPIEKPGDRIGRYKLLEQIGEGGCGVVYVAEQQEPVRRRVALKVIKLGMDTKQVIARFEAERQALAMMDHPNIARVLDAGATETGRPFFVMELVRGVKITDFCRQNQLSTSKRLQLFIQVCQAIQHAHQKGIIHRDIKPSNILVTVNDGVPVPKVIDFGIAKATQGKLTNHTIYTAFEQFVGTPAYMSPEQAVMTSQDVDTRSDIYSLGVLLYELLTGKTPFDAKELLAAGLDEMRRTIREVEPLKPSTRITRDLGATDVRSISSEAQVQLKASREFLQQIRGDLDWIVMKCLEKDRTRRYETTTGLVSDIERHLDNEPILAHPPTRFYRCQKSIQRNKLVFAAATIVVIALVAGLTVSTWMFFQERAARERAVAAEREQARLRRLAERLPELFLGGNLMLYGNPAKAEMIYREALTTSRQLYAADHPLVSSALVSLGRSILKQRRPAEAESYFREALDLANRLAEKNPHPPAGTWIWAEDSMLDNAWVTVARRLNELGQLLGDEGKPDEAEQLYAKYLPILLSNWTSESGILNQLKCHYAETLMARGKFAEAEPLATDAVTEWEKTFSDDFRYRPPLAASLLGQKKFARAETLLLSTHHLLIKNSAPDRSVLKRVLQALVQLYQETKKPDEAAKWKRALADFDATKP